MKIQWEEMSCCGKISMGKKNKERPRLITFVLEMGHQDHTKIDPIAQHALAPPKVKPRNKPSGVGMVVSKAPKSRSSFTVRQPISRRGSP